MGVWHRLWVCWIFVSEFSSFSLFLKYRAFICKHIALPPILNSLTEFINFVDYMTHGLCFMRLPIWEVGGVKAEYYNTVRTRRVLVVSSLSWFLILPTCRSQSGSLVNILKCFNPRVVYGFIYYYTEYASSLDSPFVISRFGFRRKHCYEISMVTYI